MTPLTTPSSHTVWYRLADHSCDGFHLIIPAEIAAIKHPVFRRDIVVIPMSLHWCRIGNYQVVAVEGDFRTTGISREVDFTPH